MSQSILHIAPTPFFANRGCHIRILNEVQSLLTCGQRVIICSYGLGHDVAGLDIRRITAIPGYKKTSAGFSPYRFLADFLLFFLVLKTAFRERPEILHGHLHEGGGIAWAVSRLLFWRRMRVVMDVQGSLSGELKAYGHFSGFPLLLRFFYGIERLICRLPDAIVCSSGASLEFLLSRCAVPEQKLTLLEDVVPNIFFQKQEKEGVRQKKGIPQGKDVIIYTGSLLAGKGVDLFFEAARELAATRPQWFFIFLGYPAEWLRQKVQDNGLTHCVLVPGEVSYLQLADWLALADVAVDPKVSGSQEASGKVLHYMASGLPVVCFDTANNRKLLGDTCFYAQEISSHGLADALENAFADRRQWAAMSRKAETMVMEKYSQEGIGNILLDVYCN